MDMAELPACRFDSREALADTVARLSGPLAMK
jgi:hypothetical protein